ncbi:glycosyltransferase [Lachnospiraceae bacterium 3-1]|nr:glycosyltransferase [Lachnospiraceae bacterium 3-1]
MELEQQFLSLLGMVEGLQRRVYQLEEENKLLIRGQKQILEWAEQNQKDNMHYQENAVYELRDSIEHPKEEFFPKILGGELAIEEIVTHGKSLARFGDGEFAAIAGRIRHRFHTKVEGELQQRLREVLQSEQKNLLIGIADNYGSLEKYTQQARREIRCYLNPQVRKEHLLLLSPQKTYYDAYVTRPYVMYQDNQTDAPKMRFKNLKRIWEGRKCIFVEGCYTGLGVGNDLFDNAGSIRRILGPAEDAFFRYQEILDCCMEQEKDVLFLLALGAAATVLASDLCQAGYQAVDIGHVDLEYEWFLRGKGCRTPIESKYNNELGEEQVLLPIQDEAYISQVIADFS